ncbi:MAG TPA: hypothetical protein VN207_01770 [Ktedonobacteraceae bacterium]|nr:hypothetical protein [Ktedonobacteraceae bacterium]
MEWSTSSNSDNERGLLKSNGPHQLRTSGSPFTGVQHPQVVRSVETITVGSVKVYGTIQAENTNTEKRASDG